MQEVAVCEPNRLTLRCAQAHVPGVYIYIHIHMHIRLHIRSSLLESVSDAFLARMNSKPVRLITQLRRRRSLGGNSMYSVHSREKREPRGIQPRPEASAL